MNGKLIRWLAVIVLGVATIVIYQPKASHSRIDIRGFESFALAESLAAHHQFSDPFQPLPTGPSAHLPPLYPAYVGLVMILFGSGVVAAKIIIWSAALLLALQLMLFPVLAERLGLGFWAGCLAGLAWFVAGIPPSYTWESNYAAVFVIGVAFVMQKSFSGSVSRRLIVVSTFLWGALLLLQPVAILILPCWLLLLHFRSKATRMQIAALGLLPLVVVAPWIVRNFVVFHRPVFIRDNLGLELAVSNNSCASPLFENNDRNGCFLALHPNENYDEALKVQQLGEVEYNRLRLKEAKDWIAANPKSFVTLTAERFTAFWLPPRSENKGNGIIWRPIVVQVFTLLTLPGLFLLWRNNRSGAYVVLLWLICFPPIYYVVQFMDRYRYPIFWVTFLCGSYFVVEIVRGLVGSSPDQKSYPQKLASE